jgi:hypothetical protein
MQALKALMGEHMLSYKTLPDLIRVLMHNVVMPDGSPAFSPETLAHVCELVIGASSEDPFSPRSSSAATAASYLSTFMQELGHSPEDRALLIGRGKPGDAERLLVDRALEVVTLLSLRWFAMKHHISLPEMSEYMRQKWLPPAFAHLVGQILWRQRATCALKDWQPVAENVHWISLSLGAQEDLMQQIKDVFRALSGSASGRMALTQWRKVMELIAMNPDLRQRVRRTDAVRACYGDAISQSETGLNLKNFKLMLSKTADLMGVHPVVLFKELATHADTLELAHKTRKSSETRKLTGGLWDATH